jgi:tRNA(Ile)-lysidine synthase
MAELVSLLVPWWAGGEGRPLTVWRPFLSEPKDAIRAYAASTQLAPVQDPSNDDLALRRNEVRANVLSAMDAAVPGATAALARFARLAADDDAALAHTAGLARVGVGRDGALDLRALAEQPIAIRRRLVRDVVIEQGGLTPSAERVEAVLAAAERGSGGRCVEIGEGIEALIDRGRLLVGRRAELLRRLADGFPGPLFPLGGGALPLAVPGSVVLGAHSIDVRAVRDDGPSDDAASRPGQDTPWSVDLPRSTGGVVLRPPAIGDRWATTGKGLSDWLAARRVPVLLRPLLVCVADESGVHGVAGLPVPGRRPAGGTDRAAWRVRVARVDGRHRGAAG